MHCETSEELESGQFQATSMEPWEPHMSITHEGDTEPAGPCVTAWPQVLTSSTKKGDGENK